MTDPRRRSLWRGRILALVGIVLVAFSLRSAVGALSPILVEVRADYAVPGWVVGLIGTAPPVCFALFGAITPALERRFGLERLAAASMIVVTVAIVLRALAPDALWLLLGTILLFAAVGVGNVVLPPLVKAYFPDRIGTMTAVYSTLLAVSSFVPPLVAVPIAEAVDWRFSLGMWAVFAALAAVPWIAVAWHHRTSGPDREAPDHRARGRMARLPLAWALVITFAVSSATAYTGFAWLPVILTETAGVSNAAAGALLALFAAVGLPLSIMVPIVITRWRRVGTLYAVAVAAGLLGIAGLVWLPTAATALWVVLLGIPPLLFPLVLVLLQVRTRTRGGSVALSGFVQSAGYAIAAVFPFAFGVLHDGTGSWTPPLLILGALMLAAIPAGIVASRRTTVEDEWAHRNGRAW